MALNKGSWVLHALQVMRNALEAQAREEREAKLKVEQGKDMHTLHTCLRALVHARFCACVAACVLV